MITAADNPLSKTQLLAFFGMVIGMFMAILDIQIVASSLSVIGAGLSATPDELSWVQTSYIIAEVVIIPLTGFTARLLSTRLSYFIATAGFTLMSVLCAFAWNIESMIIFRALQGFFGGAMIPTVFATVFIIFPRELRPKVSILMGLVITMAPTLGPTIGGYITDISSWHFMFLVNFLPGIFVCTVVYLYADFDKPNFNLLKNFDYLGVIFLTIGLGCLQYILEEGSKKDWFGSALIINLSILVVLSFIGLIIRELTFKNPVLDFSTFRETNFRIGCTLSFALGVGLFGSVFLMPLFLSQVAHLTTLQIGIIMGVTGAAQFLSAPLAGKLYDKGIDRRLMLAFGLVVYSFGCYSNGFLTSDSRFWEFFWPQAIRGFSLMFCFIPINDITLGTTPKDKVQNASGLYNLMRNLGGAIGLAIMNTTIIDRTKTYRELLSNNLTQTNEFTSYQLQNFSTNLGNNISNSEIAAKGLINGMLTQNALIIAINDIFKIVALIFILTLLLIPFTSNVKGGRDNAAH